MTQKRTDWDAYYSKPAITASMARKTTENIIIHSILTLQGFENTQHICELGGANSCFFSPIRHCFPDAKYTIIDNNHVGMSLFSSNHLEESNIVLLEMDIFEHEEQPELADIVFSAGLIEHFSTKRTQKAIQAHFKRVKDDGLVIITFPTPTWLYRIVRKLAEWAHLWIFHDETPLKMDFVIDEAKKYGTILYARINWLTILTQGVVIIRPFKGT